MSEIDKKPITEDELDKIFDNIPKEEISEMAEKLFIENFEKNNGQVLF